MRRPQWISRSTATARSIAFAAAQRVLLGQGSLRLPLGECEQASDIAGFIELSQATAIAFGHLTPVAGIEFAADLLQGGKGRVIQTAVMLADQAHRPGEVMHPLGLLARAIEKEAKAALNASGWNRTLKDVIASTGR